MEPGGVTGELAVRRGSRVRATDGDVGRVDEFLVDRETAHITHLVLREGHLWGQKDVLIPVSEIGQIDELQRRLYADDRKSLLLLFQAMDAAGKDSTIRAVLRGVNPAGCQVFSFKQPSAEELDHDFLWRSSRRLPERGRIGVFNRSYYEEVLVVRVHPEDRDLLVDALQSEGVLEDDEDTSIKIAIIGRPNVGKSSLFNMLAGRRLSIVDPTAGVTRDRNYHEADWNERPWLLKCGGCHTTGVDLEAQTITSSDGETFSFEIDSLIVTP